MIGKLRGLVDVVEDDALILDVGGVGYQVFCPARTLAQLGGAGSAAELVIDTHVREDHIHLYGFTSNEERDWFRLLMTVQGVGTRMAMAILGLYAPGELSLIIAAKDKAKLTAVSGVGPKLGERIVTELKDKAAKMPSRAEILPITKKGSTSQNKPTAMADDAVSALVNLGYSRSDAFAAVAQALQEAASESLDEVIRMGLRKLAK